MSTKPVPDPKEADENRKKMRALFAKAALNGLTLLPDWGEPEAKGPTGASDGLQKPASAAGEGQPRQP